MTKRIIILHFACLFLFPINSLNAQDSTSAKKDTLWKKGGLTTLTFSQSHFNEWVAGGEDAISANARVSLFANYQKGKTAWDNSLDLAYGQTRQGDNDFRKSDDMIDFNTKFGYKATQHWYYSAILQVKTQFTNGYRYTPDTAKTSGFFTPAYINLGLGMDYKPNDDLSVFMSPLNAKITYVSDTAFAPSYSVEAGEHLKADLGYLFKAKYQRELIKNVNLLTKLDLFGNYEDLSKVDVNWEVLISMKVWKLLAINLNTHLIYDNDILNNSGNPYWQFKEILGAGITYKF